MTEFLAGYAYSGSDGTVQMAGFADSRTATTAYLLFQRSLQPASGDAEYGHDEVHTTVNDQRNAAYGGLEAVELRADHLLVRTDEETAGLLGTDREICVRFDGPLESLDEVATVLAEIAGGVFRDCR